MSQNPTKISLKSEIDLNLDQLKNQVQSFEIKMDIEAKRQRLSELQELMNQENFWEDNEVAGKTNQEIVEIQKLISEIDNLSSDLEYLEMASQNADKEEIDSTLAQIQKKLLELRKREFLSGKYDAMGAIVNIQAGAGGLDASDWAAMLMSMYQSYAKNKGWKCEIISLSSGEEGGLKSGSLRIQATGAHAYGMLKEEFGVHRLVRISPFNSGKTRETSFALVEVLPEGLDEVFEIELKDEELRFDYFMSGR